MAKLNDLPENLLPIICCFLYGTSKNDPDELAFNKFFENQTVTKSFQYIGMLLSNVYEQSSHLLDMNLLQKPEDLVKITDDIKDKRAAFIRNYALLYALFRPSFIIPIKHIELAKTLNHRFSGVLDGTCDLYKEPKHETNKSVKNALLFLYKFSEHQWTASFFQQYPLLSKTGVNLYKERLKNAKKALNL